VCGRVGLSEQGDSGMGPILVTGAAGFIGFHVARRLLADGGAVVALDNLNSYYDPELKKARLAELAAYPNFRFEQRDVADRQAIAALFAAYRFDAVIHLAAQAGVRHSLVDPHAYADANVVGFLNILEGCRQTGCKHLIFASSSSVYGANTRMPLRTTDNTDHPLSLYGATKKANELIAVRSAGDRLAVFHGLRSLGTAGYGDVAVHRRDHGWDAAQAVQQRSAAARLHLYRRCYRGGSPPY